MCNSRDCRATASVAHLATGQAERLPYKFFLLQMTFDSLATSINIADREALKLTLPFAREKNRCHRKTPVAHVVWKTVPQPES